MGEAVEADLARFRAHRLRVLAVDFEVLRPVDLAGRQALGELDAQAWQRRLRVDLVFEDAKAVLGHQLVMGLAHLCVVDQRQAGLERIDGRTPEGAARQRLAQDDERRGLGGRRLRPLVGGPGRARSIDGNLVALAALIGLDGKQRAGEPRPGARVVAIEHHSLGVGARGGPRVAAGGERPVALGSQLRGIAFGLPVGLEVGLVALGVALHADVREALLLGGLLGLGEASAGQHDKGRDEGAQSV